MRRLVFIPLVGCTTPPEEPRQYSVDAHLVANGSGSSRFEGCFRGGYGADELGDAVFGCPRDPDSLITVSHEGVSLPLEAGPAETLVAEVPQGAHGTSVDVLWATNGCGAATVQLTLPAPLSITAPADGEIVSDGRGVEISWDASEPADHIEFSLDWSCADGWSGSLENERIPGGDHGRYSLPDDLFDGAGECTATIVLARVSLAEFTEDHVESCSFENRSDARQLSPPATFTVVR